MKFNIPGIAYLFPIIISNHFYFSGIFNYKVLFILGLIFLVNRIKIKILIFLIIFIIMQIISLMMYSKNLESELILFFQVILMSLGLYGWIITGLHNEMLNISPWFILIIGFLSMIMPYGSMFFSLDPMILFLFLICCLRSKLKPIRVWNFLYFSIHTLILSWRAAFVGLIAGMAFFLLRDTRLITRISFFVLSIISIWLIFNFYLQDLFNILVQTGTAGDPTSGRIAMYVRAYEMFIASLISLDWGAFFGYGFNSTASAFDDMLTVTVEIFGLEINSTKIVYGKDRLHMHNLFLQTLFEFGIVGFIIYCTTLIKLFRHSRNFSIFVIVGIVSGFLSATMYVYSSYFIVLYAIYCYDRKK